MARLGCRKDSWFSKQLSMKQKTQEHRSQLVGILSAGLLIGSASGASIAIVNGDFESDGAASVAPPSGWTDLTPTSFWTGIVDATGNPTAAEAATAPAPGIGTYFLTTARQSAGAGSQPTDGTLVQTVDLSAFGGDIDGGDQFLFVDFIWASDDDRDTGTFSLHFFGSNDGSGSELGSGYSVALDDGSGFTFTEWIQETVGGAVPTSTRSVTLQIDTTRTGGSETNIWIDNISGDISNVPEPSAALLGCLGALGLLRRRRQS